MVMLLAAGAAILCYAVLGFLMITRKGGEQVAEYVSDPGTFRKYVPPQLSLKPQSLALTLGGLFAVLGIGAPFVGSLLKLRSRRVFAIAKLGFKEAVRNRVFLVFLFFLVPFLFPANWFIQIKPEDELRTMIGFSSLVTNLLLTLPAALLAALSIPNDIKNQNIYTIVTKPVERFELILGRFVGYAGLMTVALFGMTALGWLFISYGTTIDDKAKEETFKARVPLYGQLSYQSRRGLIEGINAGREFDYRRYIGGDPATSQRAVWNFDAVPSTLSNRPADQPVPLEFTFDIFRMTKGEENKGVDLEIRATSWQAAQQPPADPKDGVWRWTDPAKEQAYKKDATDLVKRLPGVTAEVAESNPGSVLSRAKPGTPAWAVVEKLAETHGYYEATGKEIFDYHPDSVPVPAGLFRFAAQGPGTGVDGKPMPRVTVAVKCVTRGQMLGMAEPDLFLLEGDRSFTENYFKAAVGLWCRVVLIIGLAVCCSTYLAGIISFLAALLLFAGGYASDHLADMASGKSYVGGPFKAMSQLLQGRAVHRPGGPEQPAHRGRRGAGQGGRLVLPAGHQHGAGRVLVLVDQPPERGVQRAGRRPGHERGGAVRLPAAVVHPRLLPDPLPRGGGVVSIHSAATPQRRGSRRSKSWPTRSSGRRRDARSATSSPSLPCSPSPCTGGASWPSRSPGTWRRPSG